VLEIGSKKHIVRRRAIYDPISNFVLLCDLSVCDVDYRTIVELEAENDKERSDFGLFMCISGGTEISRE